MKTETNPDHKQIVCDKNAEKEKPNQDMECQKTSSSPAEQMEQNKKGGEDQKRTKRKSTDHHSEGEVDQNMKQMTKKNPNAGGENLQPKETQVTDENEEKEKRREDDHKEGSDESTNKACTHTHSCEVRASHEEATPEEQCRGDSQGVDEKSEEEPRPEETTTERSKGTDGGSDGDVRSDQISTREDPDKLNDVCSDRAEEDAFKTEDEAPAPIQESSDVD
ncbi:uncharacterized protein DDB_G0290301, partial [Oryzias melastigma]|uniref:uncharacterized protein DDB_G0290301 n=1 Tax=Oryzias melastigma TaxID=30732 RepID=UPI00168D5313